MEKLEEAKIAWRAYNNAWMLISYLSKPKAITAIEEIMDKMATEYPGCDE